MWLAPEDGSSRPSAPASWAVNQTRPSCAGLTSWGPEPSGTGKASIVNTGSTPTATVVVVDVDPPPSVDDEAGVVTVVAGAPADLDSAGVSGGPAGAVETTGLVANGLEAGDDESPPEHEATTITTVTPASDAPRSTHPSSQVDPSH